MALDLNEGCQGCGILTLSGPVSKTRGRELCRACECAEGSATQTPCGQRYCKICGVLVDPTVADQHEADFCSACALFRSTFLQPGKASGTCKCDFCSHPYGSSSPSPARQFIKLSLEPTSKKTTQESSWGLKEKTPAAHDSWGLEKTPAAHDSWGLEKTRAAHDSWGLEKTPAAHDSWGLEKTSAAHDSWGLKEKTPAPHDPDSGLRENLVEGELRSKWEREQLLLMRKLVTKDSSRMKKMVRAIKSKDTSETFYVGGVDISFIKDNNVDACAALIIISFPDLQVVYKRLEMIQLTAPYIPGFLAFREVDPLIRLYKTMLENAPEYKPDVIFVDGNGRLHPRAFGLACHLGVLLDLPCVGVAKTLIHVDGIEDNAEHKAKKQVLKKEGDTFPLTTNSGDTLGMALRATRSASNPIYVSVGHSISLSSAVTLVQHCSKYRIPEPTRFADLYSRQYLVEQKQEPEELIVVDSGTSPSDWQ